MINLKGVNLYLVGMMGCGKSTTGRALAKQLGYGFVDTDDLITQLTGKAITDIFAESGENYFRQVESKVLSEVAAHTKLVVATGGGIVLEKKNWSFLQHGLVIWLDVEAEQLWQRLQEDQSRPLLQKLNPQQVLEELLTQRRPLYRQADVHILLKPNQALESVCDSVIQEITKVLRPEASSQD
ncbi:shikimate kinase [Acaryochloris sp. 'Moss Beach']|uniref:shikimate kinase n=1 Tax=Acaryochloris sp. 'Moss Beach' TaxID=2740837 RepID=UPI001F3F7DA9|nr:shikimate kinase [Acaryochloris sp. 'Moss Beach']UJB68610.1 shikimate kinase [Acaryochloris sp. 'Moss Beach']